MRILQTTKAFISLPVLLLLLFVISLSYQFNQEYAAQRQWRFQQQLVVDEQLIWQAFEFQVLSELESNQATLSVCTGFCLLDLSESAISHWPNKYQYQDDVLVWFFEKENTLEGEYRVCAKRALYQSAYCWWLAETDGKLNWFASLPINY